MESVCLYTMPVSEWHIGDNISSWIEQILGNLASVHKRLLALFMTMGQILFILEKMLSEKFGWSSEGCAGHDLQLCVKASLEVNDIQQVVSAPRTLVEHFKKSEFPNTVL